jgi:hypothetical protein
MRKSLLLGMGVFTLAACAPYPYLGPGPRFWGPKEEVLFAYALTTLLLIGLGVLVVWWLVSRSRQGPAGALRWPASRGGYLASRLIALRERAGGLPKEKADRVMALVVEAWEAWGKAEWERAEALAARAEALVELLREDL